MRGVDRTSVSSKKQDMVEKRIDPDDLRAYSFEEMSRFYAGIYKKKEIQSYWDACALAKSAKAANKNEKKTTQDKKSALRKPVSPEDVLQRLRACKVVPVIKLDDASHSVPLVAALKEGGIDVAEITFRTACAAEAIQRASEVEGVCVGAGTVLEAKQVDIAIDGGADFIVSPGFSPSVCYRCQKRGALYLPGVVTPTEVMMATSKFGLKALKFFPASNYGGAGTLKSFSAVFPDVVFMPTGGVTEANIGDYVSLPNVMAAGGSWMVGDAAVKLAAESGNWSEITSVARKARETALAGATK